jgi:hypothetical protein
VSLCSVRVYLSLSRSRHSRAVSLFAWARLASTFFFCFVLLKGRRSRRVYVDLSNTHSPKFCNTINPKLLFFWWCGPFCGLFQHPKREEISQQNLRAARTDYTYTKTNTQTTARDRFAHRSLAHIYIYILYTYQPTKRTFARARKKKKSLLSAKSRETDYRK